MKTHTSQFKTNIKTLGKEIDSKITYTIDNEEIVLGSENLNSVTPHYEGSILKSVMKQLDVESTVDIPVGTEINYQFGLKVGSSYEYLDFGNYIVKESEKQEDTNSWKIVAYDKMLYAMKDYEDVDYNFPMTVRSYIDAICTTLGLTFANSSDTFCNYNRTISADKYLDGEGNSLGYTFRDVLDQLAEVTASTICINDDDELEIRYITNTNDTIDEEYLKDINVNFGEKFGPVNSIVLSRSAGSDNIYEQDSASISANGLCEIKISDNQIMNGNDRADYLPDLLSTLDGLEYYANDYTSTGIAYYDLCDRYNVSIGDNVYSCIMFNDELDVTQGISELVHTDMPEKSETDYKKADKTDRRINQTVLEVDKQGQTISALVSSQQTIQGEITDLQNTVEMFSVDLSQYNIVIPVDANKRPYSSTTIAVNFYGYYKGTQVTPTVSVSGSESGVTVTTSSTAINFAISASSAISNNSYTYTATFTYTADGSTYTVAKKIDVVLGNAGNGVASVTELYYVSSSATAPSAPSQHVTTSSTSTYNAWNLQCPAYTSTYKYFYTCSEIKYANGTYSWSNVTANKGLENANSTAYSANSTATTANATANTANTNATSAKAYTDAVSSQYGYRYKKDIVVYGDYTDKYYPVYFGGGNQNVPRELMIIRGYSEQAPNDWYTSTHKGGLMFRAKANYGSWGGVTYTCEILDFTEQYSTMVGDIRVNQLSGYACGVWLRGGGTTGALYHVYSDQQIEVSFESSWHATFPIVATTPGAQIGWYGGTAENPTYKWIAGNPLNAPDTARLTSLQTSKALVALDNYVDTNIQNLQNQIDGAIQFWNGASIPTLSNYPASDWTTEAERTNHQADIYTVIQDVQGELKQGKSYRFDKVNNTWQWIELTDNELSAVQALANSKAKVYVTTPTVPYNIGDLWLNNNNLYRCKTAKISGQSYSSSDWELATDYTNDTVANQALSAINNLEIGGRNLIYESSLTASPSTYANWSMRTMNNVTSSSYSSSGLTVTTPASGVTNNGRTITIKNANSVIPVGTQVTFSIDITGSASYGHIKGFYRGTGQYVYSNSVSIVENTATTSSDTIRYSGTFIMPDVGTALTDFYIDLGQGNSEITTRTYKNAKLEFGNIATTWTEAPEDAITTLDVEYYLSTSNTTTSGGSWSTTAPPWTNGKYMWSRQKVTYGTGRSITRNETCIAGAQGIPGLDGTSTYFYVRYSKNANGNPMTTAPQSDTKYMGVVTSTSSTAPTSYTAYAWSEIKGQKGDTGSQGVQGPAGPDGTSSYLHIKWSDDGVNFTPAEGGTPAGKSPGRWQGTYVDTNATDSSTFSDYNWVDTGIYVQDELNALGTSIGEVDARVTDTNTNLSNNYYNKSQVDALSDANANNITIVQQRLADLQVTSDGLVISVDNILSNGVSSVTTSAGYKFDENGLNITKTGSEVSNLLDNTGMFVKRNSTEMLGADATGVRTENLWVKKYLQVGTNSRLEDYESNRTACFYIGGAS